MILSAGGHDEQPCEVKSSTTARGSAWAGRMMAMIAKIPKAPDQREKELWAIISDIANHAPASPHPFLSAVSRRLTLCAHLFVRTSVRASLRACTGAKSVPALAPVRSFGSGPCSNAKKAAYLLGRLPGARYSLRGEPPITVGSSGQFPQHIVENAAVSIVIQLIQRIDAAQQRHALQRAIAGNDLRGQFLARLQIVLQAANRHLLVAFQPN